MKLFLSMILLISTIISCNNYRQSDELSINNIYNLNSNNIKYFIRENPENYSKMFWYSDLHKLDSIVKLEKNNNIVNFRSLNGIQHLINQTIVKTRIIDKYKQDSLLIYNCKTYADLLLLEYIIGNEFIKDYNYFLYRAPYGKIIIEKDYIRNIGNTYLSIYDPHNNNYVVINDDTIYSNSGILSIDIEKYKKDTLDVIGSYFYYKPEYGEYTSMEFSF